MKKIIKFLPVLLLVLFVVTAFMGCDLFGADETVDVRGTWELVTTGDWGSTERWVITNSTIEYLSSYTDAPPATVYKADIAKFENNGLNGNDIKISSLGTDTDTGYAVIKFTEVDGAGTGEVGKYQIFRWGTNSTDAANRDFSQGSKDSDPSVAYVNEVFDTAAAAEAGATITAGHFGFASEGAVKQ